MLHDPFTKKGMLKNSLKITITCFGPCETGNLSTAVSRVTNFAPGWRLVVVCTEETISTVLVPVTVPLPLLAGTLGGAAAAIPVGRLAVGGGTAY